MRKFIHSKSIIFCSLIVLIISSCEKIDSDFQIDQINPENEGLIVLGDQLENPYSVKNMKQAYEALRGAKTLKSTIDIEATHFYVRFKPKDNQEQTWLTRDSSIYIYDYPLDHKIIKRGTYYHDPSIPSNEITWQYTVVPTDYDFPNIQSQILEELYLPHYTINREDGDNVQIESSNWQALETQALSMTGNLNENDLSVKKTTEWRPSGNIKVNDDEIGSYTTTNTVFDHWEYYDCNTGEPVDPPQDPGLPALKSTSRIEPPEYCQRAVYRTVTTTIYSSKIPVEGIEVRARNWFTTYTGKTDSNGNFSCNGTFTGDVNYSIKWENDYFDIRDGAYGQAYYNGPEKIGSWNLVIEESVTPKSFLFAHIYRAGYTYYFKNNIWSIKKPTMLNTNFFGGISRLHIGGRLESSSASHYFDFNELWQAATVLVHQNGRNSRGIFSTTIHELAHASHWEMVGTYDINWVINNRIAESWAMGVEAVITTDVYGSKNADETFQNKKISEMTNGGAYDGYTCLVWDLIDTHNQSTISSLYPDDQAEHYTLSQIEVALPGIFGSWWTWRNNIINDFENASENAVNSLFQQLQ